MAKAKFKLGTLVEHAKSEVPTKINGVLLTNEGIAYQLGADKLTVPETEITGAYRKTWPKAASSEGAARKSSSGKNKGGKAESSRA